MVSGLVPYILAGRYELKIGRNINGVRDLGDLSRRGVYCSCQLGKGPERIKGEKLIMGIIMGPPNQKG